VGSLLIQRLNAPFNKGWWESKITNSGTAADWWDKQLQSFDVLRDFTPELHDYSVVVEFENSADKGKTAAAVATIAELVNHLGYSPDDIHSNIWLNFPGFHQYNNLGIRRFMRCLLEQDLRHKIIFIDEIDSVYPSRNFKDKMQTEEILKLNQMTKTENWFLFTRHLGTSIDKIIRDCTNISVTPVYDSLRDVITLDIINAVDCLETITTKEIYPAHTIFPLYKRWVPCK
jgi:hypothetical protein